MIDNEYINLCFSAKVVSGNLILRFFKFFPEKNIFKTNLPLPNERKTLL
jgi:hypothetical protein